MSLIEGSAGFDVVPDIHYVGPISQHYRAGAPDRCRIVPQFIPGAAAQVLDHNFGLPQLNAALLRRLAPARQPVETERHAINIAPQHQSPARVNALSTDGK
jgi:hypothetical protein